MSEDAYNKAYYVEDPFRAWKAYRSGTIVVDQEAALLEPTPESNLSLMTDPPGGQGEPSPLRLILGNTRASALGQQYAMRAGDRIFFYSDAGLPANLDEEASQRAQWNIRIRYSAINLFERLRDRAKFDPPVHFNPLDLDPALLPIYGIESQSGLPVFVLKDHWETLDAETLVPVYEALVRNGYFVPRRVPEDMFRAVLAKAAAENEKISVFPVKEYEGGHRATEITPYQAILSGFIYEPETASFIWTGSEAINTSGVTSDSVFMHYMKDALNVDEKKAIACCKKVDSEEFLCVQQFPDGSFGYEQASLRQYASARIPSGGAQGNLLPEAGLFLETTFDAKGAPNERLWLKKNAAGQWADLARESALPETQGQLTTEAGVGSVVTRPDSIVARINGSRS